MKLASKDVTQARHESTSLEGTEVSTAMSVIKGNDPDPQFHMPHPRLKVRMMELLNLLELLCT